MTLIVALKCKDGITMASDSEAVGTSSGGPIRYRLEKMHPLGNRALAGASGAISTIQRSLEVLESFSDEIGKGLNTGLRDSIKSLLLPIFRRAAEDHKVYYGNTDGMPVADLLVAAPDAKGAYRIWHIAKDCNDEFLDEIGYACSGGGDVFAYALLQGHDAKNMTVKMGSLVAYKVIKDAMNVGAYGLGEPIVIWTLKDDNVMRVSQAQMAQLQKSYSLWKKEEAQIPLRLKFDY